MDDSRIYLRKIAKAAEKLLSLKNEKDELEGNIKVAQAEFDEAVRSARVYSAGQLSFSDLDPK
jgi:hypothetical protein